MNIRIFEESDYNKVIDLWHRTTELGFFTNEDTIEGISKYIKKNPNTTFIAEIDGKIVGTIANLL